MDIAGNMINYLSEKYPQHTFKQHDFVTTALPYNSPDLVITRDVLFHITPENALKALRNIKKSGGKYLLDNTTQNVYAIRICNDIFWFNTINCDR
jgi:hypothetical protein